MTTETQESIYLVDAYSDPVCIKIRGRATYLNCAPLNDFFSTLIKKNKLSFMLDFSECSGMDSTFLGLIAGIALELKKPQFNGSITLCNVEDRNLELVRNLGLHRILGVNTEACTIPTNRKSASKTMEIIEGNPPIKAEEILRAHENLVAANLSNLEKFQDVISFLKKQMHDGTDPYSKF